MNAGIEQDAPFKEDDLWTDQEIAAAMGYRVTPWFPAEAEEVE
jgi:hypothetical protein